MGQNRRIKEVWLKYQQDTGIGLSNIKKTREMNIPIQIDYAGNAFYWAEDVDNLPIMNYIEWLEDNLEVAWNIKKVLSNLDSDNITVEQAIKLIQKYVKNETTTIGSIDSPFNEHNCFNPNNPQGLG